MRRPDAGWKGPSRNTTGREPDSATDEKTEGRTPPPARTGGGAGRGGRGRGEGRPPRKLGCEGPVPSPATVSTFKGTWTGDVPPSRDMPQPRELRVTAPPKPPQPRSSVEKPPGQGQAWRTLLPGPVPRGRSSPRPLPGSQACRGSPLGSVCFLSLSPESEDGGLREPRRPSHTCTRLGFRRRARPCRLPRPALSPAPLPSMSWGLPLGSRTVPWASVRAELGRGAPVCHRLVLKAITVPVLALTGNAPARTWVLDEQHL